VAVAVGGVTVVVAAVVVRTCVAVAADVSVAVLVSVAVETAVVETETVADGPATVMTVGRRPNTQLQADTYLATPEQTDA
jgi:hypothetical protein